MELSRPAASLALMLALAFPASADVVKDWNQTFPVSGRPTVNVTTNDGRIRVQTGPPGEVRAHVRYESRRWGVVPSGHRLPTVELKQNGSTVEVLAKEPSVLVVMGGVSSSLRIDVTVPADCDLSIRSGDGDVELMQRVTGRVEVTTGDGDIRLRGARGQARLSTGDGAVLADSLDGALSVRTGDGRVEVNGRFDLLRVESGDGTVRATALRGSTIGGGWQLETRDGPLTLAIPRAFAAELDARVQDGSIDFRLPVKLPAEARRREVRGLLNEGGARLTLRTQDGRLTLKVSD